MPPKRTLKAKCAANQAALDRLAAKKESSSNDRYGMTLKRAMEALGKCTEPILTHKDALALKFVGSHCATIICPPDKDRMDAATKGRMLAMKRPTEGASSQSPASSVASDASSVCSTASKRARRLYANETAAELSDKPTNKEVTYEKAVQAARSWKSKFSQLTWRVVLIIDGRERQCDHMQAKCQMSGIPCEERFLPIGDMAWMAQGKRSDTGGSSAVVVELMLGTIIERKTPEDLKASLFGSRYNEQGLRLQHSGLPQVLYLVEGDMTKDIFKCKAETLHTAVWETRLHKGFSIINTAHMEETVMTLKRIHRRILQRTFPVEFARASLPIFPEAHSSQQPRQGQNPHDKRRRRIQSLAEMTYDTDPVPPLGMDRFVTYQELKAKIERDREAGTKTVQSIHLAMLKQVATWSDKKVQALAEHYPTANSLFAAVQSLEESHVSDLPTHDEKSSRNTTIGPRSAAELLVAYKTDDPNSHAPPVATRMLAVDSSFPAAARAASTTATFGSRTTRIRAPISRITTLPTVSETTGEPATSRRSSSPGNKKFCNDVNIDALSPDETPPPAKRSLNTSLGSLLNSSSDEGGTPTPAKTVSVDSSECIFQRRKLSQEFAPDEVIEID
jgi:ERCC4-type nuclease